MRPLAAVFVGTGSLLIGFAGGRFFTATPGTASPAAAIGVTQPPSTSVATRRSVEGETLAETLGFEELLSSLRGEGALTLDEHIAILTMARNASPQELRAFLTELENEEESHHWRQNSRFLLNNALIHQWTDIDPYGSFAFCLEDSKSGKKRTYLMSQQMLYWTDKNLDAALASAESIKDANLRQTANLAIVETLAKEDPRAAFRMMDLKNLSTNHQLSILFSSWADQDPEAAMRAINTLDSAQQRQTALHGYYSRLARKDPNQAVQHALYNLNTQEFKQIIPNIFSNWAQKDTEGALAYLASMDNESLRADIISRTGWNLIKDNHEQVYLWARQNLKGDSLNRFSSIIVSRMSNEDPQKALNFAQQHLTGQEYQNAISNVVSNWASKDLDAALAYATSLNDEQLRSRVAQSLAWRLAEDDPEKGLIWVLGNVNNQQMRHVAGQMVRKLGERDPQRAAELIETIPYGESYSDAVRNLASSWTKNDPHGAVQWIYSLRQGPERDNAFQNFAETYASDNTELALQYAQQFPAGDDRNRLILAVASAKAQNNPDEAIQWAFTIPDEDLRRKAQVDAIRNWGSRDINSALKYIQDNPQLNLTESDYRSIGQSLSYQNASAIAQWSLNLSGDAQKQVLNRATERWLREDTYAASAWIAKLPEGPARQEGLKNLVNAVYRSEPDAAFDWALAIEDKSSRQRATTRAINEWIKRDPNTAWNRVNSSPLSNEEKQALFEKMK